MKLYFKQALTLFIFSLLSISAFPATVKWLIKPNYDRIEIYCSNAFKCYQDGKIQVFDGFGNPRTPLCDSVTNFSNGYALVLDKGIDETKWSIKGFLYEETLQFTEIPQGYYTMMYSHFSDKILAVGTVDNKYGYLNTQGIEVIPCHYQKARPFINGWAIVQIEDNRVLYINKADRPMTIQFHHGEINEGTSFNQNGEAVVIHYKKTIACHQNNIDMAVINTNGEMVRKYTKPNEIEKFYRRYDRAFCEDGKEFTPPGNKMPQYNASITSFFADGLYGYRLSNFDTLPAQFTHAEPFANNCAIVSSQGRYGILVLTDENVSCNFQESGKKITCLFEIPTNMTPAQINLDPGNGLMAPIKPTGNKYSFTPSYSKNTKESVMRTEIWSDGILLLRKTFTKKIKLDPVFTIKAPVTTDNRANLDDIQTIKSSITNNSTEPIQITVSFTVSESSKNKFVDPSTLKEILPEYEEEIPPGKTKDFYASVLVAKTESTKITITAITNNKKRASSSATVNLIRYEDY